MEVPIETGGPATTSTKGPEVTHSDLMTEIRYAERLSQRTARMYRRMATVSTFLSIVGGSAVLSALAPSIPSWVSVTGAIIYALFGAANIAMRPTEKAILCEQDGKRYAALKTRAKGMTAEELEVELHKARETDAPEIEGLRGVAYNDVSLEEGFPTHHLSWTSRALAVVA